jgi:serine/threonine protein kinase
MLAKQAYDYSSDYWAVGVILYEMIVGNGPFNVTTTAELFQMYRKYDNPKISYVFIYFLHFLFICPDFHRMSVNQCANVSPAF